MVEKRDEERYKLLERIKKSPDGKQFLEYLEELSLMNYKVFKKCDPQTDEFCKGYAVGVDSILDAFAGCTSKLASLDEQRKAALETEKGEAEQLGGHG